jgi:hypothetical protein
MNNALPPYVFLPTGLFLAKLIEHKEGEDRSSWVTDFAVQLVEGAGRDDFARSLIDTAILKQNAAMNRVRRSRAKSELISEGVKNPTRQQIEERLKEIYAEEEITAAAATREGVDESTTGCIHYDQEADQASTETLDRPGAGEATPESVSAPSPALPAKHPHGEFGNVMLTTDEYIKLCEKCQDADSLITELDQYIESQGKTKKYKSHYATLLNWSRRKAQEAKPKQGYLTSDDISKKNYQESKARLEAMFSKGRETA